MMCALLMGFSGLVGIGLGVGGAVLLFASGSHAHGPSDETIWGDASTYRGEGK